MKLKAIPAGTLNRWGVLTHEPPQENAFSLDYISAKSKEQRFTMTNEESMPKWDIALAALARDEFRKRNRPLTLDDFHRLARQHAIRLDDIMETLFLLAINGEWTYSDNEGRAQPLDRDTLDSLYVKGRLSDRDLSAFDGRWQPV